MKRGYLDIGIARAGAAIDRGATLDGPVVHVDAAGDCNRPVGFSHTYSRGYRDVKAGTAPRSTDVSMFLDGEARCRRCEACLRQRRREWTARALRETKFAQRTWFGTMTLNPTARMRYLNLARQRASYSGVDYDVQTDRAQFTDVVRLLNRDVTLWLKRVRESSQSTIRYVFVVERHKDGAPHLHCLVHECIGSVPVTGRLLSRQWEALGFTQFRLVKLEAGGWKAPHYVCKYLAKDALTRVRASLAYGEPAASVVFQTVDAQSPTSLDVAPKERENNDPPAKPGPDLGLRHG